MNVTWASFASAIASMDFAKISSVLWLSVKFAMHFIAFLGLMHTYREGGRVRRVYTNMLPAATMFQVSGTAEAGTGDEHDMSMNLT